MKKIIGALVMAFGLLFAPAAANATTQHVFYDWKNRILLRVEGGECGTNGRLEPSYNLYIVPRYVRENRSWVQIENGEVRIPLTRGGQPCV